MPCAGCQRRRERIATVFRRLVGKATNPKDTAMVKVKFTADFRYKPHITKTTVYRKGMVLEVPTPAATAAIAAGKAVRVDAGTEPKAAKPK